MGNAASRILVHADRCTGPTRDEEGEQVMTPEQLSDRLTGRVHSHEYDIPTQEEMQYGYGAAQSVTPYWCYACEAEFGDPYAWSSYC